MEKTNKKLSVAAYLKKLFGAHDVVLTLMNIAISILLVLRSIVLFGFICSFWYYVLLQLAITLFMILKNRRFIEDNVGKMENNVIAKRILKFELPNEVMIKTILLIGISYL